jgi:hypothetical protein
MQARRALIGRAGRRHASNAELRRADREHRRLHMLRAFSATSSCFGYEVPLGYVDRNDELWYSATNYQAVFGSGPS